MLNKALLAPCLRALLPALLFMHSHQIMAADAPVNEALIKAFIGSTDIHHQQKNYASYLSSGNAFYESVAWRGDELNSKIVVLTKEKSLHHLTITASDLVSDNNDKISSSHIDITWLKDVEANLGRGKLGSAPNELFPDVLYTRAPIDAAAKKVARPGSACISLRRQSPVFITPRCR